MHIKDKYDATSKKPLRNLARILHEGVGAFRR
jgi:hypothetical protein